MNLNFSYWPIICISIICFSRLSCVVSADSKENSSLCQRECGDNTFVKEFSVCVCFIKLYVYERIVFCKPDNPKLIHTGLLPHFLPSFLFCKIVEYREGNHRDLSMLIFGSLRCALSKKLFSWMCSWWISITYNRNKSKFLIILDYMRVVRSPEQLLEVNGRKEPT